MEIEAVTVEASPGPTELQPFLRTITPDMNETSTVIAKYGSPPNFSEPYATPLHLPKVVGAVGRDVTEGCGSSGREKSELMLAVHSGAAGVHISKILIDYVSSKRRYTLEVPWELVMCGASPQLPAECEDT